MKETKFEKKFRHALIRSGFHVWPHVDGFKAPDILFEGADYSFAIEIKKKGNAGRTTKAQRKLIRYLQCFKQSKNYIIKMVEMEDLQCLISKNITQEMLLNLQDMTSES